MRGVFNPDSPLMRALGVVWDLIVLNLLFLVMLHSGGHHWPCHHGFTLCHHKNGG